MASAPLRRLLASVVLVLIGTAGSVDPSAARAATPPPRAGSGTSLAVPASTASQGREPATVTLITGDRVIVQPGPGEQPRIQVEARPGDDLAGFTIEREENSVRVIPDAVARLVPEVLDPDLFNVTRLVEMGYDDNSTDALPLIVHRAPGVRRLDVEPLPITPTGRLDSIEATTATLAKSDAAQLGDVLASIRSDRTRAAARALGGATKIYLDGKVVGASIDGYLDAVNAPQAWETGLDGSGVTVAVLDSGIDGGHPTLDGQVVAEEDFTGEGTAADLVGHGTHVASLVAGNGAGAAGARQGIAPAADLLNGRVLNKDNEGLESWVIAGMEWAVSQDADLVNMSLGGPAADHDDPVVDSLEALTKDSGTLFVVAAGNRGGRGLWPFTINSPGTAPSALTVGATDPSGVKARFSSEGPTTGDFAVKPDIVAPGVNILGAQAGAREGDLYTPMTGTSMATPIVAGAAALLKQAHPGWSAQQIKSRIVATADGSDWFNAWEGGSGQLDVAAATSRTLNVNTATLDLGYLAHPDNDLQHQQVRVTNTGAEAVTLSVTDTMTSNRYLDSGDLEPAPDSAVTAEPALLQIPAGGSAVTTITLDPEQLTDTIWQGVVRFQDAGQDVLRLPIGVYDEPESYDLDVQVIDRNGDAYDPANAADRPNARTYVYALNADTGHKYRIELDAEGRGAERVRAGHYSVFAHVATPGRPGFPASTTFAGTAELLVDSDTSYAIDARDGERLHEATVAGQRTRASTAVGFTYHRTEQGRGNGITVGAPLDPQDVREGRIFITPTPPVSTGTFEAVLRWELTPIGKLRPGSPDRYDVVWNEPQFAEDMTTALSPKDLSNLALVEQTVHPAATTGAHAALTGNTTTNTAAGWVFSETMDLPASRTVLATAEPDVFWQRCLGIEWNFWNQLCRDGEALRPGSRTDVEIGGAVHAAAVDVLRFPELLDVQVGYSDGQRRMKVVEFGVVEESRLVLETPDGDRLGVADAFAALLPVPKEQDRFKLTHEWHLDDGQFQVSSDSRTVWEFRAVPGYRPILLDADYGPDLDAMGMAAPNRPLALDVSFESGALSPNEPVDRIVRARIWQSTDAGGTWNPMKVRRTSATTFAAHVPGRALSPGTDLSLRLVAEDGSGNSVDQTSVGLVTIGND